MWCPCPYDPLHIVQRSRCPSTVQTSQCPMQPLRQSSVSSALLWLIRLLTPFVPSESRDVLQSSERHPSDPSPRQSFPSLVLPWLTRHPTVGTFNARDRCLLLAVPREGATSASVISSRPALGGSGFQAMRANTDSAPMSAARTSHDIDLPRQHSRGSRRHTTAKTPSPKPSLHACCQLASCRPERLPFNHGVADSPGGETKPRGEGLEPTTEAPPQQGQRQQSRRRDPRYSVGCGTSHQRQRSEERVCNRRDHQTTSPSQPEPPNSLDSSAAVAVDKAWWKGLSECRRGFRWPDGDRRGVPRVPTK